MVVLGEAGPEAAVDAGTDARQTLVRDSGKVKLSGRTAYLLEMGGEEWLPRSHGGGCGVGRGHGA